MATIVPGRTTHEHDGEVVLFLIGMRVNRLRAVRAWLPVMRAMPVMLRELAEDPASGLLGVRNHLSGRGATSVQYWRDLESLLAYAHADDRAHRPAWAAFNRAARDSGGAVGVWHETYLVPAGRHESVYVDMPLVGLQAATAARSASGSLRTARGRLGGQDAGSAHER